MTHKYVVKLTEDGKQYVVKKVKKEFKKRSIKKDIINLMNLIDQDLLAREKYYNEIEKNKRYIKNLKDDLKRYKKLLEIEKNNGKKINRGLNIRHKKTPKYSFIPIENTT